MVRIVRAAAAINQVPRHKTNAACLKMACQMHLNCCVESSCTGLGLRVQGFGGCGGWHVNIRGLALNPKSTPDFNAQSLNPPTARTLNPKLSKP